MKPSASGRSSPEAKKAGSQPKTDDTTPKLDPDLLPIPPPIVAAAESSLDKASAAVDTADKTDIKSLPAMASLGDAETWMKYLTLGYGSAWGGKKAQSDEPTPTEGIATERGPSPEVSMRYVEPKPDVDHAEEKLKTQIQHENNGYFIIGLKGNMEEDDFDDENDEGSWNNRIPLRTVYVELSGDQPAETPGTEGDDIPSYEKELILNSSLVSSRLTRLRPVIYVVSVGL